MIKDGKTGWEDFLPPYVDEIIKEKELFGYRSSEQKLLLFSDQFFQCVQSPMELLRPGQVAEGDPQRSRSRLIASKCTDHVRSTAASRAAGAPF